MIQIDHEKAIAIVELHGAVAISDIQKTLEELFDNPEHMDGMDELWDFRDASVPTLSVIDLKRLAFFASGHLGKRLARRVAIVVGSDLEYGIGRMWLGYAEPIFSQDRFLCRNIEDAFYWLAGTQ